MPFLHIFLFWKHFRQKKKSPCQNLLKGSEEKYSQRPVHKGDMKQETGGSWSQKSEVIQHKSACGNASSKRGLCCYVCVNNLEQTDRHG